MLDFTIFQDYHEYGNDEIYGLYDLITKRFVYINTNIAYLKMVAVLFSSRYRLYLCRLDCASNHAPNIVDNDVATAWGIKFTEYAHSAFAVRFDYLTDIYEVQELIELGPLPEDEIILKDIPYFAFVREVINELELFLKSTHDGYNNAVDNIYKDTIQVPFVHPRTRFLQEEVFPVIYKEYDLEVAKEKIRNAFQNYTV